MIRYKILNREAGERVDLFLAKKMPDFSRGQIQKVITVGAVKIDKKIAKSSTKLKAGDTISLDDKLFAESSQPDKLLAENIPLEILFENNDLLVINKPAGLVVHPAAGNKTGTLVNAILNFDPKIASAVLDKSKTDSVTRPGIIHRLDKDTSGVILVARTKKALISLSKQLQNKTIKKNYLALVYGWPQESGSIKSYLARGEKNRKIVVEVESSKGKEAISNYKVMNFLATADSKNHLALVEVEISTGRTHQIRVQFKGIGHPIIGDQTYNTKESREISKKLGAERQMLHAASITFTIPGDNQTTKVNAELPVDFQKIKSRL